MRACPVCKNYYPDGAMNCAQDGETLVDVPPQERTASIQVDSDVHRTGDPDSYSDSYPPWPSGADDETRAASPGASRALGSTPSDAPILASEPLFASQASWQASQPSKRRRADSARDMAEAKLGEVLGSYRLLEVLGLGGMGTVYRAEHVKLGREVALKLLHQDYAQRRDAVARFFQEARAVNKIRHRNIVDVTDLVELDDGTTFLVMELLRGVSLTKLMRGASGLDNARALAILVQICDGLSAAHSVGIVHRDLKPDNIFVVVTPDGMDEVKLVDFGVAKLVGTDHTRVSTNTVAGAVVGTPAFMSPEQAGGLKVDERSDVYSLGAIMFEIFAGRPLFRGKSFSDYVRKHLNEHPPLMRTDADGAPIDLHLEEVVQTCLKKSPDQRYQSARALRDDLVGLLAATDADTAEELALPPAPGQGGTAVPQEQSAPQWDSAPAIGGPVENGPVALAAHGTSPPPPAGHPPPGAGPAAPVAGPPGSGPLQTPSPSSGPWPAGSGDYATESGAAFPPPVVSESSGAMQPAGPHGGAPMLDTALTAGDLPRDPSQQRGPFRWSFLLVGALALAGGLGVALLFLGGDGGSESAAAPGEAPPASGGQTASEEPSREPPEAAPLPIVKPMEEGAERSGPERLVTVRLVSRPRANVFSRGSSEAACSTPCDLTIDPGDGGHPRRRDFLLRRSGYRNEVVTVDLQNPDDVIKVALERREEDTEARADGGAGNREERAEREDRRGSSRRARSGSRGPRKREDSGERARRSEEEDAPPETGDEDPGRPYDPEDTMNPFGPR